MHKAKKRALHCCYCCTEVLSGFLLLMLVACIITLLRYFLEFYKPMPAYSGNKTNLINTTTTPKPGSQSFASVAMLPQSSAMTFNVVQHTFSSPQSLISSVDPTLQQQTSPTNHLQEADFPQAATEKTSSLSLPPPLVSVAESTLLHRLTSSTKRPPEELQTLPMEGESPQQPSVATKMTSSWHLTLSHDNRELTSMQQETTTVKLSSSQDVTPVSPWQRTLPLNVTHSQKPFSSQTGENETMQYFKGSFNLINETYHSEYSDSTSDNFRDEALKLENMISKAFAESRLKQRYQDSSIMELKPSPFRAHFIVRMRNGIHDSRLSRDTVIQEMIQGYQKASGSGILMDKESLQVEEYSGLCLLKPSSPSSPKGANNNWNNDKLDKKEGFPWHVIVLKDGDPVCKGSMVTEKWVLTTSSCVESSGEVSLYSVQFGAEGKHARRSELYSVAKILHHSSKAEDDLVLIQLARSPLVTASVHPICLPDPALVVPAGTECKSLGSKKNGDPDIVEWTVSSPSSCGLSSSTASLCAETDDLKKHTQITTGGSFVCPGEDKQLYLEGIVPSTMENQGVSKKKEQLATFTRVAPRVSWIQSQVLP